MFRAGTNRVTPDTAALMSTQSYHYILALRRSLTSPDKCIGVEMFSSELTTGGWSSAFHTTM